VASIDHRRGTRSIAFTDLEHVVDEVFGHFVEQAARRNLLDLTYRIDSTDVRAMPADQDAPKCYDPTAEGTTTVTAARSSPPGKRSRLQPSSPKANKHQRRRRCASRVTRSPSTSRSGWSVTAPTTRSTGRPPAGHRVVPVAPYNARNTDDPKDIEYRVEDRITEHSEDVQLKAIHPGRDVQPPHGVERTNESVRTAASGERTPEAASTTSAGVPRTLSAPRGRNHQLRTRRQSGEYRDHGVRTLL